MTDPLRSDRPPSGADVPERERDARVEDLLLNGLDHYFAGHYDLAISVWTRVLFLNHGHARARAYIERARSAISEQQREGEELLHSGVDAFVRGDGAAARHLLTSAVERGASSEEALAVLERLNRLEAANGPHALTRGQTRSSTTLEAAAAPARSDPSRAKWMAIGVAGGVAVAATAAWLWLRGADWLQLDATSPAPAAAHIPDEPLPVPTASEASIARARTLYAKGHLHEALTALDGVRHGDARWLEADTLRATIQRELLDGSSSDAGAQERPRVSRQ